MHIIFIGRTFTDIHCSQQQKLTGYEGIVVDGLSFLQLFGWSFWTCYICREQCRRHFKYVHINIQWPTKWVNLTTLILLGTISLYFSLNNKTQTVTCLYLLRHSMWYLSLPPRYKEVSVPQLFRHLGVKASIFRFTYFFLLARYIPSDAWKYILIFFQKSNFSLESKQ